MCRRRCWWREGRLSATLVTYCWCFSSKRFFSSDWQTCAKANLRALIRAGAAMNSIGPASLRRRLTRRGGRSNKQSRSKTAVASPDRQRPSASNDGHGHCSMCDYVVLFIIEGIAEPHFDLMFETLPGSALATWRFCCSGRSDRPDAAASAKGPSAGLSGFRGRI